MTPMRIRKYVNCMVLLAEPHPFGTFLFRFYFKEIDYNGKVQGGEGFELFFFHEIFVKL